MSLLNPLHGEGYQFWSGIGSDLTYLAGVAALLRHLNCHKPGCWRHGRITHNGGRYCRIHDPR